MGSQTDLYHTQGRFLGAAVEAPHGLRGEALIFAKKPYLLQTPITLGSIMEIFQQIDSCVKQLVS